MSMRGSFERTAALLGNEAEALLGEKLVTVFGLGGVGGHCAEALARGGIGSLHLVDADVFSESNLNRQLFATKRNIGRLKVEAAKERIEEVSDCFVTTEALFVTDENAAGAIPKNTDYIVDAIDTVTAKLALIRAAKERNIPVISCMGAGNRLDPTKFTVRDIYETSGCPLARVMRRELRKLGVDSLKVLFSTEEPIKNGASGIPGSVSYVPGAAGLALAGEVIRDICGIKR